MKCYFLFLLQMKAIVLLNIFIKLYYIVCREFIYLFMDMDK